MRALLQPSEACGEGGGREAKGVCRDQHGSSEGVEDGEMEKGKEWRGGWEEEGKEGEWRDNEVEEQEDRGLEEGEVGEEEEGEEVACWRGGSGAHDEVISMSFSSVSSMGEGQGEAEFDSASPSCGDEPSTTPPSAPLRSLEAQTAPKEAPEQRQREPEESGGSFSGIGCGSLLSAAGAAGAAVVPAVVSSTVQLQHESKGVRGHACGFQPAVQTPEGSASGWQWGMGGGDGRVEREGDAERSVSVPLPGRQEETRGGGGVPRMPNVGRGKYFCLLARARLIRTSTSVHSR